MLVSTKEMIEKAYKEGYAVGAFNVSNLETLKAVIQAAEAKRAPIILATTETAIAYAGLPYLLNLMKTAAELSSLPMAIHLDHGRSIEMAKKCLEVGFTSVMFDGSHMSLEENIKATKEVAGFWHSKNIPVEGEVGELGADETKKADIIEAKEFVEKTSVDYLAPGLGTSHGVGASEHIDLDLLSQIRREINIPLVLHGGSGVQKDEIQKAIKLGIAKINIHTELRLAFINGFKKGLQEFPDSDDHRDMLKLSIAEMQKVVEEKIDMFGSAGKV